MTIEYQKKLKLWKEGWKERSQRAVNYVKQNEFELRRKYGNDYIAIMEDCGVIDRDNDRFKLIERISKNTYTEKFIFIYNLENIINPKIPIMDSPDVIQ